MKIYPSLRLIFHPWYFPVEKENYWKRKNVQVRYSKFSLLRNRKRMKTILDYPIKILKKLHIVNKHLGKSKNINIINNKINMILTSGK